MSVGRISSTSETPQFCKAVELIGSDPLELSRIISLTKKSTDYAF